MLREWWHLVPSAIADHAGGLLTRAWDVVAGNGRYVVRLAETERAPVEAGLAAADHAHGRGAAVGRPLRTLHGELTVETPAGVYAVLRRVPGRALVAGDPADQRRWGERLGAVHTVLQGFHHSGLRPWRMLDVDAAHLAVEPWLRGAIAETVTATIRLTVTDRLTYGVLHGDPAPGDFVLDPVSGRTGVIDWGARGIGPLVYDVAAAIFYAGGPDASGFYAGRPDASGHLLAGYLAAGPVGRDELDAALPVLLRFRWAVQADRYARSNDRAGLARAREALKSLAG